jgi:hypothetical protein
MAITNDFVPFCSTDTGTNLEEQAAYLADPQLLIGNQTGIARSPLVNKVLRQASYIASLMAQYVGNTTNTNMLDNAEPINCLAQFTGALSILPPIQQSYLSGSGTWNAQYVFFILSGNATVGATYTNNSITFTVISTVSSALQVIMSGIGTPTSSGVLTKASGTGDATITFLAVRAPISIDVTMVGGGGGGSGSGTGGGSSDGANGTATTFGSYSAGGGGGSLANGAPGAGGTPGAGTGNLAFPGATGTSAISIVSGFGAPGGSAFLFNGGTYGVGPGTPGTVAIANSGGGGGGGGPGGTQCGGGGGGGASVLLQLLSPTTFAYSIGTGGGAGAAGSSGVVGGDGADGILIVTQKYQ